MTAPTVLAVLLPAVPGAAGLAGLLLPSGARPIAGRGGGIRLGGRSRLAAGLGIGAGAVALAAAVALLVGGWRVSAGVRLADFGDIAVGAGVHVDPTAAVVAVAVGAVTLLVQVYSVGYLRADEHYPPYAAQISLFAAAMLTVVVATDLVQLLVGWEVMGICSYLLIAHDRALPAAPAAALKAFLVTRVGDVGFWLGVVLLGTGAGSFRIGTVLAAAGDGGLSGGRTTAACLLLLAGLLGKSAQFPLHTWLPDAMAGPTPVSALIHAATMVAAGIYLVGRLYPLFLRAPVALAVLGVLASVSMLLGALAASAQDDIKRILAWSTVSQVGYMGGALAVGSTRAAIFQLLSHAAFKALLFLAVGSVLQAAGAALLSRAGGLRRALPLTFATMTVGLAALAGVPPLAGFWSKESVLGAAAGATGGTGTAASWTAWLVLSAGLVTAALTGWYATRLWLGVFFGARHAGVTAAGNVPAAQAAREPGWSMRLPLLVLAVPAAALGLVLLVPAHTVPAFDVTAPGPGTVLAGLALTALGVLAGYLGWRRERGGATGPLRPLFESGFHLDTAQQVLVVRPVRALSRAVRRADRSWVDGTVRAAGSGALRAGGWLARRHTGLPRYLTAVLTGAVLLGVLAIVLGGVR